LSGGGYRFAKRDGESILGHCRKRLRRRDFHVSEGAQPARHSFSIHRDA
jgi:hypothetical protein